MVFEKSSARSRTLAVTPLAMLCSGSIYAFGIYSDTLRELLHLTNTQVNIVALGANIGMWVCFHAGIWVDYFGPRSAVIVAMALCFTGYFLLYMRAKGHIGGNEYAMAFYAWFFGSGCAWIDVSIMSTAIRNFPDQSALVSGFTKLFLGLSASILAIFYNSFFYGNGVDFLLFMAIFSVICLIPVACVIQVDEDGKNGLSLLNFASIIGFIVLAICGTSAMLDAASLITPPPEHQNVWFTLLALIWILLLVMQGVNFIKTPELSMQHYSYGGARNAMFLTPSEALQDWRFWTLFTVTVVSTGAGLMMVNNVAEIYKSYHDGDDSGKSLLISLFGIFNGLGRIVIGLLFSRTKIPTTKAYSFISAGIICCYILMIIAPIQCLLICECAMGFLYGSIWVILPSLCQDFFGMQYFATIYGISCSAAALGSLLFSTLLAGKIYDSMAVDNSCRGTDCFQLTYTIILCANGIAFLMCIFLYYQTLEVYETKGYFQVATSDDSTHRTDTDEVSEVDPNHIEMTI